MTINIKFGNISENERFVMEKIPHLHQHENEKHLQDVPDEKAFIRTAETFQLISDATRLKILWLLCHNEICVNNIAVSLNMSSPAVSHHLRLLKQAGLIENRREGKEMYYKLTATAEAALLHRALDDILDIKCPL